MVMFLTEQYAVSMVLHASLDKLKEILLYQPPVGLVLLYLSFRLSLRFHQSKSTKNLEEYAHIHQIQQGRSWILDMDDKHHFDNGGVEVVRRHLCRVALRNTLLDRRKCSSFTQEETTVLRYAVESLRQVQPTTNAQSRLRLLNSLVTPLHTLDSAMKSSHGLAFKKTEEKKRINGVCDLAPEQLRKLVDVALQIASIRFTDSLVRLCRDHALQSAHRLARTVEYWKMKPSMRRHVVKQRLLATAAYSLELERLGNLERILMRRPKEPIGSRSLVSATIATAGRSCFYSPEDDPLPKEGQNRRRAWYKLARKYYFRWSEGGLRKLEDSENIDTVAAADELLKHQSQEYETAVREWIVSANEGVRRFLDEAWYSSKPSLLQEKRFNATMKTSQKDQELSNWKSMMSCVVQSSQWLRIGEGQKVRLGLKDAWLRIDWGGIPSACLGVLLANSFHQHVYLPQRWPEKISTAAAKSRDIWSQRVWIPLREIFKDLLNTQSEGIMSALALDVEQESLDKMLRDLSLGDGTAGTRQSALEMATEEYKTTYGKGVLNSMVRGRLLELLLLQVQQLKVGLLTALDYIDVLLKGNQINFKLMAAIPAGLLLTYFTRILVNRFLFNIRARDLRPVTVVHREMSKYLDRMEELILLSRNVEEEKDTRGKSSRQRDWMTYFGGKKPELWETNIERPEVLGEFLLCIHRYLILLDYGSPPFVDTDKIHSQMYNFLGVDGSVKVLDAERHLHLLNRLKEKHKDLLKWV